MALLLGMLACCGAPELASWAYAEEGNAAPVAATQGDGELAHTETDASAPTETGVDAPTPTESETNTPSETDVVPTETDVSPTEDAGDATEQVGDTTGEFGGSTEADIAPTGDTMATDEHTLALTDDRIHAQVLRKAIDLVRQRPVWAAIGAGVAMLAIALVAHALTKYRDRPYALRRRRRHYVA